MATILIAEDEELIRMMMAEVLSDEQYTVLEAGSGEAALAQLDAHKNVDLLITDMGLPGLDGRRLVQRARDVHPNLKAIFVTGYSQEILLGQKAEDGAAEHDWVRNIEILRKPFDLADLIDKVRAVLKGS